MPEDYKTHIVSDNEYTRFIHRCAVDKEIYPEDKTNNLKKILKEGLVSSPDLTSIASLQTANQEIEQGIYNAGTLYGALAIIIAFPRQLFENARSKHGIKQIIIDKKLGYFHPIKRNYTVRPEFIEGYIDRTTNEFHPNPYPDRKPLEGHEEFDHLLEE